MAISTARAELAPWVRATALGWILGIPAIVLLSVLGEALGLEHVQSPLGLGMGAALGLAQAHALRRLVPRPLRWPAATLWGLAAPFLAWDLAALAGSRLPWSLLVAVPAGGLLAGLLQAPLLRPLGVRRLHWALASLVGWALASDSVVLADGLRRFTSLRGLPGALAYLALVAAGGVLLGLATGLVLRRGPGSGPAS